MMLIALEMLQSTASKVPLFPKAQDFPLNPQTRLFAPQGCEKSIQNPKRCKKKKSDSLMILYPSEYCLVIVFS